MSLLRKWLLGFAGPERDVVRNKVEEREGMVAQKVADKIEHDAETRLQSAEGLPQVVRAREEIKRAWRIRRGEEDWLEDAEGQALDEMYDLWRRP